MNKDVVFESLKEVLRWVVLFVVSWFVTETLKQVVAIPEYTDIRVWVFVYSIPVRMMFQFLLTGAGRWIDRAIHDAKWTRLNGVLPF